MHIRLYNPSDYKDIVDLCKYIWEGNDYLPHVINDYHQSPHCKPYVLIEDDKVVSVANANFFTKNFVWFQAIRTLPEYRSKGFGTKLSTFMMEEVKKDNAKEIWLSTSSTNEATAKMLSKQGFTNEFDMSVWSIDKTDINSEIVNANKGLYESSLVDINFLPEYITDGIKKLANYWKTVTDINELNEKNNKDFFLFSEFMICPSDSYFITEWIENKYLLKNEKTGTIAVVSKSKERENVLIVGITKSSEETILSILYYCLQNANLQNINLKLFYHNDDNLSLIPNPKVFRIMRKILT